MGIIKNTVKKITALSLAFVMSFSVLTAIKSPLKVDAAFEAKHYDLTQNGGYWDGVNYELNGEIIKDAFFTDGKYTYFLQADGTPMKDRLTYHPDGVHVIYFDKYGHEVFSNFKNVKQSIAGDAVNDLCFFDVYGYMYTNFLTYDQAGVNLYYANPYGVMECNGWFQFAGDAGSVAEAFGITEGTWGYAYPNGVVDPASIGDDSVYSSFIPNQEMMFAYNLDDGIDDSYLYYRYKEDNNSEANNFNDEENDLNDDTNDTKTDTEENQDEIDVTKYSYEIVPLFAPFNRIFLIKTDNPEYDSFRFIDVSSEYTPEAHTGILNPAWEKYADVDYNDETTLRVNGGYIAWGEYVDGGEMRLQKENKFTYSNGITEYSSEDTDIIVKCPKVIDYTDYLIDEYTNDSQSFFEKMDAVQEGLDNICLYRGASVRGKLCRSEEYPYYGLSTSPHMDQTLLIQDPYYYTDGEQLLVSQLYPFILDSLGFPGTMAAVAGRIDSNSICESTEYWHDQIYVTFNGEKKMYGGAGHGGGQLINNNQIKFRFKFDGSSDDAATKININDLKDMIEYYGTLEVPEEKELEELTWEKVGDIVGEGAYVRLLVPSNVFGDLEVGYTYLYKIKDDFYPGYLSNVWFDGRYFNNYEYFEFGKKFEDAKKASILLKKAVYRCSDDNENYYYKLVDYNQTYNKNNSVLVWQGYMYYHYNYETDRWESNIYANPQFFDNEYYNYKFDNESMIRECTITESDVKKMNIDRNSEKNPSEFLIFDKKSEPGSVGKN